MRVCWTPPDAVVEEATLRRPPIDVHPDLVPTDRAPRTFVPVDELAGRPPSVARRASGPAPAVTKRPAVALTADDAGARWSLWDDPER